MESILTNQRRLPPEAAGLPCIQAEIKYRIGDGRKAPSLEGAGFDRAGNFYVCYTAPNDTSIRRITPEGGMSEFCHIRDGMTIGFAEHPDGRLFFSDMLRCGIRIFSPGGTPLEELSPRWDGQPLRVDCMEFDWDGNLWFTDLRGTVWQPDGGLYRLSARSGYREIELMFGGLASPNGLCFAPGLDALWLVESNRNCLVRMQLDAQRRIMRNQFSPMVVYHNAGKPNMDSIRVDEHGNIYAGIMYGGRAMIFDPEGIPLANILAPGFARHKLRYTPNLALSSRRSEGYLLASDEEHAYVLSFPALGRGAPPLFPAPDP